MCNNFDVQIKLISMKTSTGTLKQLILIRNAMDDRKVKDLNTASMS